MLALPGLVLFCVVSGSVWSYLVFLSDLVTWLSSSEISKVGVGLLGAFSLGMSIYGFVLLFVFTSPLSLSLRVSLLPLSLSKSISPLSLSLLVSLLPPSFS